MSCRFCQAKPADVTVSLAFVAISIVSMFVSDCFVCWFYRHSNNLKPLQLALSHLMEIWIDATKDDDMTLMTRTQNCYESNQHEWIINKGEILHQRSREADPVTWSISKILLCVINLRNAQIRCCPLPSWRQIGLYGGVSHDKMRNNLMSKHSASLLSFITYCWCHYSNQIKYITISLCHR